MTAGYTSDDGAGYDLLDSESDVQALARLLAAREVLPPISVGLFGDRGSGKTFFMHRLAERLAAISADVGRQNDATAAYLGDIVQVRYNAWHNVETNPWVGLAEAVYQALDEWVERSGDREFASRALTQSIGTARKIRQEIESNVARSDAVLQTARSRLESTTTAHDEAMEKHADCVSTPKWSYADTFFGEELRRAGDTTIAKAIDNAGDALGLTGLSRQPERLERVLEQAKTVEGRANIPNSSLQAKRRVGNAFLWFALLLVFFVAALTLRWIYQGTATLGATFDTFGKILIAASTLIGFTGVVLAAIVRNRALKALDELQKHEQMLQRAIIRAEQRTIYDRAVAEERLARIRAELTENRARLEDAERARTLARRELAEFESVGILRRVSEYYRGRLLAAGQAWSPAVLPRSARISKR